MLTAILVLLVVLWVLGLVSAHTLGGLMHPRPVLAIDMPPIRVIHGRNPIS